MPYRSYRDNTWAAAALPDDAIAPDRRIRGALLGMVLMGVLALVACQRTTFEAPAWRDADLSTRERAQMAPDLVASGRLDGLDRTGVVDLLGPPTATDKFADSEMVYLLGPEGGLMAIDHQWLLIELDRSGRVEAYRVVED